MTIVMDPRTAPPVRSALLAARPSHGGPRRAAHRSSARTPRRVAAGVLVGALTMLGVTLLDAVAGATVPVLGSLASLAAPAGAQQVVEVAPPSAAPGTCLNWTRTDASDTQVVDCAQPHLFEQAGAVRLTDQTALPDDALWRQLVRERCEPAVRDYLGGKFDPDGRYRVGALKPSPAKWAEGDRELRCGLQSASRSGALYPLQGRASEDDQSAVHEPGTCLAIDGRTIGDPVDCGRPHAVEAVGVIDLGGKFPESFPAVDAQDGFLQTECTGVAAAFAGGDSVIADKKLTVYWDNLTEESWTAGTRRVNCNLAALLPDRSGFAPVTGSVRGPVTVGDTPAPPASDTPEPGAPAEGPPTTAPAPSTPSDTPGASSTAAPPSTGTPSNDPAPPRATDTATVPPPATSAVAPTPEQPEAAAAGGY
jgi:Septum formation